MVTKASSQKHGDTWESKVIESMFGVSKKEFQKIAKITNTHPVDIPKGVFLGVDVLKQEQVKTSDSNKFGCGDSRHFYKTTEQGVILSIARYLQEGDYKKVYEVHEFDIKPKHHKMIYGSLSYKQIEEYFLFVKSHNSRENRKWLGKMKKDLMYGNDGLIKLSQKIGPSNGRVQCELNIKDLINSGIPHKKYTEEYRGIELPKYIKSSSRKFRTKLVKTKDNFWVLP